MEKINETLVEALQYTIKGFLNASNFDRTVKGTVTAKSNKYTVLVNGSEYSADSLAGVGAQINDTVYILVPQNDWDNLVIVGKKEK